MSQNGVVLAAIDDTHVAVGCVVETDNLATCGEQSVWQVKFDW